MKKLLKIVIIIAAVLLVIFLTVFILAKMKIVFINEWFVDKSNSTIGVDISSYQADVDMEKLKEQDIRFVYIKASEGSKLQDDKFASNWENALKAGLPSGAYHFFSFDSPGSDQAENFIASAKASWSDPAIRALRPAVDVEWYGDKEQNPPVTEDVHRELRAFVDGVEAACGQKPLIYAGNDIYDRYLRGYFDDCELWIACRKWPAWVEWPRGGWTIWQYSDTGELAGALNEAGHVDLDVLAEGVSVEDLAVSPKSYR